jgi:pyrrolidone-carboxylate peptidase
MKILIYGFTPYKQHKHNTTEQIIKRIKTQRRLTKIIFPVEFNTNNILSTIKKHNPDAILGLGQHPRARKIRIERKAVNQKADSKKQNPRPVIKNRAKYSFTSAKLKKTANSRISYNAGKYVCNFSMYIISQSFPKKRFAFIHIPKHHNLDKATRFIESKLKEISS